jgi:hypothetical protein
MWAIVSFFNPMIALLLICIIPLAEVGEHKESLLFLGQTTGGSWLAYLISIDAVLVLCGAVLTSFVGVSGLLNRMTLDRILPNYFLKQERIKLQNNHQFSHYVFPCYLLLEGPYCFSWSIYFLGSNGLIWYWKFIIKIQTKNYQPRKRGIAVDSGCISDCRLVGNVQLNVDSLYFYQIPDSFVTLWESC